MAAAELFAEHGYDETTVTQIAERAGVTKSTLFRHFPDKREILVAGQATLSALLTEGVADAGEAATPMQAVASGLRRASSAMQPWNRALGPSIAAAIAANAELRERSMLKSAGLAVALSDALEARGTTPTTARVAAELGVLAFERGYTAWTDAPDGTEGDLEHHVIAALEELRVATASLG